MSATPRPLRLVLVEDSDGYAALVGALLAAEPVPPEVAQFARLDAALRHLADADAPDCVLLDLELPDATGTESVERLLASVPHVPVVVLTGHGDEALTGRVIRAGAQDFLVKGSETGGALMRAIRKAIDRRRTGDRQEVERLVREVAAGIRARPAKRRPVPEAIGLAALVAGFAVLAIMRDPSGLILWALFAAAAGFAWRATRRVHEGAGLLEAIVEGTSDAVYVKDLEGRYILVNDALCALLGHPSEHILGRTDFELVDADTAQSWRARDVAVMTSGEARRHWRTGMLAGVERTLSTVKVPYRDRAGRTAGIIGISRDETEMRRLEEESSRFFDLAPDMLGTIGLDGRLQRVNEAWTTTLGWTSEELRSRPLVDFLHPQDRARGARDLERMMNGALDGCVHRVAARSGGWRDVEWTARVVAADERVYAVARDVTDRNAMASALASSEARYRTLVHNLPRSSVVVFDHELRFTFAAGEALALAGLDGNVLGRTLAEVLPTRAAELTPRYRAALAGHEQAFEFAGGDGRHYWCQMAPVRDGDGAIEGGMLLSQEITPLRQAERDLAHAEGMLRTAFEEAPIGMGVVSPDGRYLRVNRALCAITGYAPEQLLGTAVDEITHPEDVVADAAGRADLVAGRIDIHRAEKRYLHADGGSVWVSVHATLVRDTDGNPSHILAQVQDITDRRRFEERLQHLVDHDPLTGLFNRRRFEQELDRRLAESARYGPQGAVLVLDLDDFKLVNDTLGHNAGDELIVAVAGLLKAQLRDSDVIARLGGDEFAVLLPTGGLAEAEAVATKLVHAVREKPHVVGERRPRRVTTSVGVAPFDGSDLTGEELLVNADLAMYEAKEAGRDGHVVYASRDEPPRLQARMRWVERIRDALEDDRFVLHAQPILDLRTGEVGQHELLVRMLDDNGVLIPPAAFLQVAERFDLVQDIDRWVARKALGLIASHDLRLTVNLSGRTLGDDRLLAELEAELARSGADPGRLTFEVTETAAVANIQRAREFAERLREIGCRFALDDFGAGFGSFYYLKHLPFDYLKIDGEFVSGCLANRTDQLVIRAVVDIAQGLGKETVAEFAADAELVDFLRSQGVDHAQGFHIGRPLPLELALLPA